MKIKLDSSLLLFLLLSLFIFGCENRKNGENKKEEIAVQKVDASLSKKLSFKDQGMKYALQAKGVLGSNLFKAIKAKGTVGAISFCNEKAYSLTDSVATSNNVKIKRVSDKNRNQGNIPNNDELNYINTVKLLLSNGEKILPQINEFENNVVGYYPIIANQLCMKCHGKISSDIEEGTLSKIKELYPNDKATGYAPGELRGIWVIEMPK